MNRRLYVPGDLLEIDPHNAFTDDPKARLNMEYWIERTSLRYSRTLTDDGGKPLAVIMMRPLYTRVWQVSAFVDKAVEQCGYRYVREVRRCVDAAFEFPEVVRMQMFVRCDRPWAVKWATSLGFSFEGKLRKFGTQEVDHFLYAKVRE
jgi:hypothetical protein